MSKATFVSEIPNEIKGNEVPTLNLVKSMIPDVVEENTITEYNKDKDYGTVKYTINGKDASESEFCTLKVADSSFKSDYLNFGYHSKATPTYNSETKDIIEFATQYIGPFQISKYMEEIQIGFDYESYSDGTYEITLNLDDGEPLNITAEVSGIKEKTDMYSNKLMNSSSILEIVEQHTEKMKEYTTQDISGFSFIGPKDTWFITESINFELGIKKLTLKGKDCVSCDLIYKGITYHLDSSLECLNKRNELYDASDRFIYFDTTANKEEIPITNNFYIQLDGNKELEFELKNITIDGKTKQTSEKWESKEIIFRPTSDMNDDEILMTANAVRGYVEAILKEHKLIS